MENETTLMQELSHIENELARVKNVVSNLEEQRCDKVIELHNLRQKMNFIRMTIND